MFKREISKMFKTGIMPAVVLVCIITVTLLCVAFSQTFGFGKSYRSYGVASYESVEEIPELIEEAQGSLAAAEYRLENQRLTKEEKAELKEQIAYYEREIKVYQYLYEHGVAYADYNDYGGIRAQKKDNAFCAFTWLTQICSFALPLVTGLIAAVLMPWDFHSGTYKYLYSASVPRKKFIWTRYFAWLVCAVCTSLALSLSCAALGLMYGSASGVVVYATATSAFGLNYVGTVLFETLLMLFKVVATGTIVFGCSMLAKNAVLPILVNVALCAGTAGLSVYCSSLAARPFLYVVCNGFCGAFAFTGTSLSTILLSLLLMTALAASSFIAGYIRLNYRNIY